ncbi:hypothetical protein Godav_025419 [Gossypium davidsonii]|uniref:Uncharacterized protein n=1 Tax=Gossypium davidsonii TaxID=34287 RepID=A0A7J8TJZ7_GOSDV|nr:hypothetical protein [Gossypium davidsonii]
MKVQIYQAAKNARKVRRSLAPNTVASRLRTRSLVNDTEPDCTWGCLKLDLMGKMQPLTPTEKQRAADIASWSSSILGEWRSCRSYETESRNHSKVLS